MALTVPAYVAADLIRRDCPDASLALKSLDYPPVAAVTLAYPMSSIRQDRLDEAMKLPGSCFWLTKASCHRLQMWYQSQLPCTVSRAVAEAERRPL